MTKRTNIAKKLAVFLVLILFGCGGNVGEELKRQLAKDPAEFGQTASSFLSQDKISSLTSDLNNACEYINSWKLCPAGSGWEKWNIELGRYISLPSEEDVLKEERIPEEVFKTYKDFMDDHDIESIKKSPGGWIEFENKEYGLRYNIDPGTDLKPDTKFLTVTKLGPNWYYYTRRL